MATGVGYQGEIGAESRCLEGQDYPIVVYGQRALTLLSSPSYRQLLDPTEYPICISRAQFDALELPERVFDVLTSLARAPSQKAGLPEKNLCLAVKQIDEIYQKKMESYRKRLGFCIEKDAEKWRDYYSYNWFYRSASYAISLGGTWQKIRMDGSAARISWFSEVSALEKERLQKMKNDIFLICEAAFADVKKDEGYNERSQAFIKLTQLVAIYHSEFPQEGALIINGENVYTYLKEKKE